MAKAGPKAPKSRRARSTASRSTAPAPRPAVEPKAAYTKSELNNLSYHEVGYLVTELIRRGQIEPWVQGESKTWPSKLAKLYLRYDIPGPVEADAKKRKSNVAPKTRIHDLEAQVAAQGLRIQQLETALAAARAAADVRGQDNGQGEGSDADHDEEGSNAGGGGDDGGDGNGGGGGGGGNGGKGGDNDSDGDDSNDDGAAGGGQGGGEVEEDEEDGPQAQEEEEGEQLSDDNAQDAEQDADRLLAEEEEATNQSFDDGAAEADESEVEPASDELDGSAAEDGWDTDSPYNTPVRPRKAFPPTIEQYQAARSALNWSFSNLTRAERERYEDIVRRFESNQAHNPSFLGFGPSSEAGPSNPAQKRPRDSSTSGAEEHDSEQDAEGSDEEVQDQDTGHPAKRVRFESPSQSTPGPSRSSNSFGSSLSSLAWAASSASALPVLGRAATASTTTTPAPSTFAFTTTQTTSTTSAIPTAPTFGLAPGPSSLQPVVQAPTIPSGTPTAAPASAPTATHPAAATIATTTAPATTQHTVTGTNTGTITGAVTAAPINRAVHRARPGRDIYVAPRFPGIANAPAIHTPLRHSFIPGSEHSTPEQQDARSPERRQE